MSKIKFDTRDDVEIIELTDKETKRPILTFFIIARKIAKVYQHRLKLTKEIKFNAQYTKCDNAFVAAGYELATQLYGKEVPPKQIPAPLRISVLGALPQRVDMKPIPVTFYDDIVPTLTPPATHNLSSVHTEFVIQESNND